MPNYIRIGDKLINMDRVHYVQYFSDTDMRTGIAYVSGAGISFGGPGPLWDIVLQGKEARKLIALTEWPDGPEYEDLEDIPEVMLAEDYGDLHNS